jgi:hypothetical protein
MRACKRLLPNRGLQSNIIIPSTKALELGRKFYTKVWLSEGMKLGDEAARENARKVSY